MRKGGNMITDEIQAPPVSEKEKMDTTRDSNQDAPVVNGTNVDTLPKPGKQVSNL